MVRNCSFILNKKGSHLEGLSRSGYSANSDVISNFHFSHFRILLQLENGVISRTPFCAFLKCIDMLLCFYLGLYMLSFPFRISDIRRAHSACLFSFMLIAFHWDCYNFPLYASCWIPSVLATHDGISCRTLYMLVDVVIVGKLLVISKCFPVSCPFLSLLV